MSSHVTQTSKAHPHPYNPHNNNTQAARDAAQQQAAAMHAAQASGTAEETQQLHAQVTSLREQLEQTTQEVCEGYMCVCVSFLWFLLCLLPLVT